MDVNELSNLSEAEAYQKLGEFWDTHDFTDFDNPDLPDVEFEVVCKVTVEASLLNEIEQQASQQGVKTQILVDRWLRQKLAEQKAS